MAGESLFFVTELRRQTINQACRALSACLGRQTEAEKHLDASIRAIRRETDRAMRSVDDTEVEAFAAWLRHGRERVRSAEIEVAAAGSQVASARAALNLARAASTERRIEVRGHRSGAEARDGVA